VKETKKPENDNAGADEVISDDDMEDEKDADDEGDAEASGPMTGIVASTDLPAIIAKQKQLISNEEKMHTFFNNPEKSIRVFMSSYSRTMGYIWYFHDSYRSYSFR